VFGSSTWFTRLPEFFLLANHDKTPTKTPTKAQTKTQTNASTKAQSRCGGGVISVPP